MAFLRLVAWLGLAVFFVGLALGLYSVAMKLSGKVPVSGFTALMVAICTFAGAQMLMLGVIGEYVGRIFLNLSAKPQYHVREATPNARVTVDD